MGVRGLTTFIDEHRFLSVRVEISDTKLVFDGYSLLYHLYITAKLDMKHGGENLVFYGVCQTFVTRLRQCGIEPVILIDGALDTDEKKMKTIKDRHKDRIQQALSLAKGGHGFILPLMALDVFRQVLIDHDVNFAQCDFEADSELSALANAYNCPLVSNDSDFYVTDLTGGFIHLKYFHYEYPKYKSKLKSPNEMSSYLECKIYHVDKFCEYFKINKSLLPLLGTLQGNDYVERFLGFRLKELIGLLAIFNEPEEAVKYAVRNQPRKVTLKEKIQASMEMYTANRTSKYVKYFQTKEINQKDCQLSQYCDLPLWFKRDFRDGLLTADTLNAFLIKKCFLANFIEGSHHASSNAISLPIRKTIYGFIHQNNCSDKPVIEEYDREGSTVKCRSVCPSYCSLSIHNIRSLNEAQSKSKFLDCILLKAKDLSDIKEEYQLVIASMIYWIKNAKPKVFWRHIIALLLGISISTGIKTLHEKQSTQCNQGKEDYQSMLEQRFTNMRVKFKAAGDCFDVNANHMFSQWQSVLKHISQLNAFLSFPLMMLDVSVVYNGTFVHGVYNFLKTFQKPEKALEFINQSHVLENNDFCVLSSMYYNVLHHGLDTRYKIGSDVQRSKGGVSGVTASGYDRKEAGNRSRRSRSSNSGLDERTENVDQWSIGSVNRDPGWGNRGSRSGERLEGGNKGAMGGGRGSGGSGRGYGDGGRGYGVGGRGSWGYGRGYGSDSGYGGGGRECGDGGRGSGADYRGSRGGGRGYGGGGGRYGEGDGRRSQGGGRGSQGGGRGSGNSGREGGATGYGGGGRGYRGRGSGGGGRRGARGRGYRGRGSGGGSRGSQGGGKGSRGGR